MTIVPPSRMTKTQLVEELRKLQERGPELVTMTKEVESADSRTLFGRAERDFTKQALVRSFGAVRSAVGEELEKLLEQMFVLLVQLSEHVLNYPQKNLF